MNRFTSRLLVSSTVATTLTGAGYFWAKYLVRADDPWAVISHPLEPWFLKAHIVVVPILLLALGLFVAQHVSRHYALGTLRTRIRAALSHDRWGEAAGEERGARNRGGLVDFGTEPESVTGVRLQTPAKRRATAPAPSHATRSTTGR